MPKTTIDVELFADGSLVGFRPCTEAAREWFMRNVSTEPWQWLGDVLYVDSRYANDLRTGIEAAGLEIS